MNNFVVIMSVIIIKITGLPLGPFKAHLLTESKVGPVHLFSGQVHLYFFQSI